MLFYKNMYFSIYSKQNYGSYTALFTLSFPTENKSST